MYVGWLTETILLLLEPGLFESVFGGGVQREGLPVFNCYTCAFSTGRFPPGPDGPPLVINTPRALKGKAPR